MKIYEIALFIFTVNMVIGLMNLLAFTDPYVTGLGESKIIDVKSAEQKVSSMVGENQNWLTGSLNWLVESVRLSIQGIGAFISLLLDSTILSYNIYYKFLCYGGVDCSIGSFMWTFAGGLASLTYLVYTVALIQFATGKNMPQME